MIKSKYILSVFLLFSFVLHAQIYVSPRGNDQSAGDKENPVASLTKALSILAKSDTCRTILLQNGTYFIGKPIELRNITNGTEENPVIIKAEKEGEVIISGGAVLEEIYPSSSGLWKICLPKEFNDLQIGQLYVNGKRRYLAHSPDNNFFKIIDVKETVIEKGSGRIPVKAKQEIYLPDSVFELLLKIPHEKINRVRFKIYHKWDFSLRYIDSLDKDKKCIITYGRGMKPWNSWKSGSRLVLENFIGALTKAGEWIREDDTVYYFPMDDEKVEESTVVVPIARSLLTINGESVKDKTVKHLRFIGLKFVYCGYDFDRKGFEPNQAAVSEGAAVMIKNAEDVSFVNCEIAHTAQHALWFGRGSRFCNLEHCYLHDLGGGGVYIGEPKVKDTLWITSHITLNNNIIQTGGKQYPPAVGVWIGNSSDNNVLHNDIGNFYYSGVSVGWVWGYAHSVAKRNIIRYNHIHHIGWDLLSDMAGVYTLGKSEGTVVSENIVHHIHAYSYGGWGLYTDEGSSGILMENNLVYSTKTGGFHQHYGENNVIRNNIFAFGKRYQLQCTRVEDHLSFVFKNNIVVFDEGEVLHGPWFKINIEMDSNIYWNITGKDYSFAGKSFKQWRRKSGHDKHSFITNPGFADAKNFDFQLSNKRKMMKIGFVPFDYDRVGVYGQTAWKKKAELPVTILKQFDQAVEQNMKD